MANIPFSMRMNEETKARLEAEAKHLDRPVSYVAVRAIESYLASQERKRQAIDDAVHEANKGHFISSEAMHAWVDSWGAETELPMPEPDIFSDK